jgi:hypothetical protein
MNRLISHAAIQGRDYVTPEDVSDVLSAGDIDAVRLDLLEVLAGACGCEDSRLCAHIAWRGTPTPYPEESEPAK